MRFERRRGHPLVVELVGAPGSGKSTLLPTVIEAAEIEGFRAFTVLEASRVFASRTVIGRAVLRLVGLSRRRAALWGVFYLLSTVSILPFIMAHPRLAGHLLRTQVGRPAAANAGSRRVVFWYLRLMGTYRFLLSQARVGEVIVLDEGFLHRAVQLHASEVEIPAADMIDPYVGRIPRPDLVVHLRSHVRVCAQRVVDRGVWRRFDGLRPAQLSSFVASAHRAVELAVSAARHRGWTLVETDTDGTSLPASRTELRLQVMCALAELHGRRVRKEEGLANDRLCDGRLYSFYLPKPGRVKEHLAARLAPPSVDSETVECVLERYGLRARGRPKNLPLGWRNRNVVVETEGGRKVLKQYPGRWADSVITYEHSILNHLASVGFPAPHLQVASSGETIITLDGGRYALFDFERGVNLAACILPGAARERLVQQSARLLGRLHLALDGFRAAGCHHLERGHSDAALSSGYLDVLTQLMEHQPTTNGDVRWQWLAEQGPRIGARIARLREELEGAPLRLSVIHGDFGVHNISFERDGTAVVHDFELARVDWQLVDLVIALSRLDPGSRWTFVEGYREVRPIALEAWRLLPQLWEFYRLCGAVRSWSNFVRYGDQRRLVTAGNRVTEAERIAREGVGSWL